MAKKITKYLPYIFLTLILAIALVARLYKIDNPIADWHSWRQADTASVGRYFYQHGINLLVPRYDDRSALASGKINPQGYRMVEFPIYNALHAIVADQQWWNFDRSGRTLSVFFSLLAIICLFGVVRKLSSTATALLSALVLALMPFAIYYSRVVLPDPMMTFLWLLGTWALLKAWFSPKLEGKWYWSSAVIFSIALLVRPYFLFFMLPFAFWWFGRFGKNFWKQKSFYLYLAIVFVPFILWRLWEKQFVEGIPAQGFLFNYSNIRFSQAWFRWLFGERLGRLILGFWGLVPLSLGLLSKPTKKENWFYQIWFLGVLLYFSVFAGGNVMHDYYQAITTPILAVLLAKGIIFAFSPKRHFIWPITPVLVGFSFLMMLGMSWYQIRDYYNINNWSIVHAGQEANKILPANALVVAPYQGDTAFLYQINRPGFPIVESDDIRNMIDTRHVTHYVSVNYDAITNQVLQEPEFKVLEKTPEYVIVQLREVK